MFRSLLVTISLAAPLAHALADLAPLRAQPPDDVRERSAHRCSEGLDGACGADVSIRRQHVLGRD